MKTRYTENMKDILKKELYVAVHGQTARFRMVKYAILIPLFGAIYWWGGWNLMAWCLGIALVLALAMHFFFRWKTNGWEEDWGPYKSLFKK